MTLNKRKKFNTKRLEKTIKNKNTYYNFFLFMIGMAISAISVSVFYSPNGVVTTGSTGLAIILNKYLNIDLSLLVLCLSSILLVLSFLIFGVNYGSKHILGTILFPIFIKSATLINEFIDFISERVKGLFGNILKSKYKDVADDLRENNIITEKEYKKINNIPIKKEYKENYKKDNDFKL